MNEPMLNLVQRAAELQRKQVRVLGCLLINARGSTPQQAGALMLVDEYLQTWGTIGGGCVEAEVRQRAHRFMSDGATGVLRFKLNHDYGWDDGLICGGTIELAIGQLPAAEELDSIAALLAANQPAALPIVVRNDSANTNDDEHVDLDSNESHVRYELDLQEKPRLLIAGAGHVGQAVARQARLLEFNVTMIDDRIDLLRKAAPDDTEIIAGDIAQTLADQHIDHRTFILIVTRGHRHDEQALHAVVGRGAGYVGMIGSRRKVKLIYDDLIERGVAAEDLEQVHAPVGLPIDAVTVEEIAVSIAAQLVQVRRQREKPAVRGPLPIEPATVSA